MNKQNRYFRRMRARLVAKRGGKCEDCPNTKPLEWAHVKPTALNGDGRGYNRRTLDIRDHPDCYKLLCKSCHNILDGVGNGPEA